jgi:thiol-disulfide isomerase/thioredoxin
MRSLIYTIILAIVLAYGTQHFLNLKSQFETDKADPAAARTVAVSLPTATTPDQNLSLRNDDLSVDFEGKLISGKHFHLQDVIGKKMIVLSFFASWCEPCRLEVPNLNDFFEKNKENAEVLAITSREALGTVQGLVEHLKIKYPVLLDGDSLVRTYNIQGYPAVVIIGVDGHIQFLGLSDVDPRTKLDQFLKKNLSMLNQHQQISASEFKYQNDLLNRKVIFVEPFEAKPTPAYNPSIKDEIHDIRVISESSNQMNVEIDYTYSGSLGEHEVYIDCDPHLSDGGAPFGMRPAAVKIGIQTTHTILSSYSGTPKNAKSVTVVCDMNSRLNYKKLASKTINHTRIWKNE